MPLILDRLTQQGVRLVAEPVQLLALSGVGDRGTLGVEIFEVLMQLLQGFCLGPTALAVQLGDDLLVPASNSSSLACRTVVAQPTWPGLPVSSGQPAARALAAL
ncbi:hypothetical protein [Nocardia sp. CC201C]|uniref:hypothetical protein n=1 Tax=Nocardia sp. CC201C TaxID=3044575 RepID=UPI0024A8DC10|nr:hypothetical protein [Nocardia sp. CC201C]